MFADGSFPIHVAAEKGDVDNLKFLLSLRASPDLKNRHGQTAIMLGIIFPDVVQTLIDYQSKVNLTDAQRRTALHLAGAHGLPEVVQKLLLAGARTNIHDKWGRTPLHVTLLNVSHNLVCSKEYVEVVRLLLAHGSDVNWQDKHHSTPLFLAVNCGNQDIVELLIRHGAQLDHSSRHYLTPLMLSTLKGFDSMCKLLVTNNCDVNVCNLQTGRSCFQVAVTKGHFNIAKLLVDAGCNLHEENWLYSAEFPRNVHMTDDMKEFLQALETEPPSLKLRCKTVIRRCLRETIHEKVESLEYPDFLKNYILLKDIL